MTKLIATLAIAGLLALGGLAGAASAARSDGNREATALQGARLSLVEAISMAEQRTGGKAYDAGVNMKGGRTRIVVETTGPKGVQTVLIDAQTGQVAGSHAGGEPD